jgi:cell division protease FtsH
VNSAATLSVQANELVVSQERMLESIEKALIEKANKGIIVREEEVDEEVIPPIVKRHVAVYTAAKGLLAYITPFFDEVVKITSCPSNQPDGKVFFVPREEELEMGLSNRSYLESRLVVMMAGRAAERIVFGSKSTSALADADITSAYYLARDMVFKHGYGRRVGPINLAQHEVDYLRDDYHTDPISGIDPFTSSLGAADIGDLLAAAESKAYYGLATNYRSIEALSSLLDSKSSLNHEEIKRCLEENNVLSLPSPFMAGFFFDPELSAFKEPTESQTNNVKEAIMRAKKQFKPPTETNDSINV